MAELADALDSGSSEGSFMQVQVLLSAPCRSVRLFIKSLLCKDFFYARIFILFFTISENNVKIY